MTVSVSRIEVPRLPPEVAAFVFYRVEDLDSDDWLDRISNGLPRSLLAAPGMSPPYVLTFEHIDEVTLRKMGGEWYVVDYGG